MFTRVDNASKVALVHLCRFLDDRGFALIDCQVLTGHLLRMGAEQIRRHDFVHLVERLRERPTPRGSWDDGQISCPLPPASQDATPEARHA
jgi:leucyl/phenylalanyl-tRNA--protein transferase